METKNADIKLTYFRGNKESFCTKPEVIQQDIANSIEACRIV